MAFLAVHFTEVLLNACCMLEAGDNFQTFCHLLQIIKPNILNHCESEEIAIGLKHYGSGKDRGSTGSVRVNYLIVSNGSPCSF